MGSNRGAIAAGNAVLETDSNTFLGTPIIEAHELEANQDWIGLAFSHSALWPPLIADITPELLMEYKVPVKEGIAEPISPDWPRIWRSHHNDECPSAKLRELANAQRPKFRKYYLNAAQFAEHSRNNSYWYNEPQPEDALLKMRPYEEVVDEVRRSEAKRS